MPIREVGVILHHGLLLTGITLTLLGEPTALALSHQETFA